MGKKSRKKKGQEKAENNTDQTPQKAENKSDGGSSGGITALWNDRSPVLKFVLLFGLLIGLFYLMWATQWFHDNIVKSVTQLDAKIASVILNIFGWETKTIGNTIDSNALTLNVKTGCDGLEAMAMFSSGVIAYTASLAHKFRGLLYGIAFLFALNIIRILHLYVTGVYMPTYFEFFHQNFWQIVFIFLSIVLWAFWINRIKTKKVDSPISNVEPKAD